MINSAVSNSSAGGVAPGLDGTDTRSRKYFLLSQRAERLKDPKVRKMGIDREALDAQVREKAALKQMEKDRDAYYDRQAVLMDRHACALQQEVNAIRAAREREMTEYRDTFQRKEQRREWDLSNPDARRSELPARVGDADPRNGPASMQRFEGEDLDYTARRAAQQEQQRRWARQQVEEKLAKKWLEQERDRGYDDRNEETNARLHAVSQKVTEQRRLMERNAAEFNRALAEQQRSENTKAKADDDLLGLTEVAYQIDSAFLNERQDMTGELGDSVHPANFKGMSDKQKTALRKEQDRQLAELRRRRFMEVEEEKQWAQQEAMQLRMANALERQRERERRAERMALAETQMMQADAAAVRRTQMNQLYTNAVDEDYFKYWDRAM